LIDIDITVLSNRKWPMHNIYFVDPVVTVRFKSKKEKLKENCIKVDPDACG